MKLRFLYTLGLLLCLSNFASPNECTRHCQRAAAQAGSTNPASAKPPAAASIAPVSSPATPAASASERAAAATEEATTGPGGTLSPTLIKLLYI